jgi:hypothetical protein
MQTFLPYPDFYESAKCLDWRRLGKQRVEGMQLLNATPGKGWYNHPARKMWAGYENALKHYVNCMINEWVYRGYKNKMLLYFIEEPILYPPWYLNQEILNKVIQSHRSNLLRKDSEFYGIFNWGVPSNLPYYWPVG